MITMREVILVLHNIRSTYNVGAILRTGEGLGIAKAVYSGYTPRYNDVRLLPHLLEKLNRQIAKAALGAEELVAQEGVDDLDAWIREQRSNGHKIVGLENNLAPEEQGRKIVLDGRVLDFGPKVVLVLGEEVHGIPSEIRANMDYFLEIPMHGRKESFNVSVAAGIAMFELAR